LVDRASGTHGGEGKCMQGFGGGRKREKETDR
jgi:hypothetical protein